MVSSKTKFNLRRASVLFAGCMMQNTFGTPYSFANMNPYLTSYMRQTGVAPSLNYTSCAWVYVSVIVAQAALMPAAGIVQRKIGSRKTCALGCFIFCSGVFLSYFSIQHSFGALIITYGITFGVGIALAYMVPLTCAMKWMTEKPGLANGIVNGGAGAGLIFNMVQTAFINPENKEVTLEVDGERYFDQKDILDRVPYVFLVLGASYSAMNIVGCLLLVDPPEENKSMTIHYHASQDKDTNQSSVGNDVTMPLLPKDKDISKSNCEEEEGISPSEALKSVDFYLLYFSFLLTGVGVVFLNSLYKAYGLTFINDDLFLSLVGTLSSFFNFSGRVFWGFVADKISFRVTTMVVCTLYTTLILTLQISQYLDSKYLFMLYICLLIGTGAATFSLIPTAIAKRFGKKHVTTNYGMVYASQVVTAPLTIFLSQTLLNLLGWNGFFFIIAAFYYAAFVLAYFFQAKDKNGKDI